MSPLGATHRERRRWRPPTGTAGRGYGGQLLRLLEKKKKKKRNKDSFLEAGTRCELRLGSAPGFGSRRAGKAAAFRSDIFQMRRFDFDLI